MPFRNDKQIERDFRINCQMNTISQWRLQGVQDVGTHLFYWKKLNIMCKIDKQWHIAHHHFSEESHLVPLFFKVSGSGLVSKLEQTLQITRTMAVYIDPYFRTCNDNLQPAWKPRGNIYENKSYLFCTGRYYSKYSPLES